MKLDDDKPRFDLLPWHALEEEAYVLSAGARKYAENNWRLVKGWRWRYAAAAFRHITAWLLGWKLDKETKLHHLAHAACCVHFALEMDLQQDLEPAPVDVSSMPLAVEGILFADVGAEPVRSRRMPNGWMLRAVQDDTYMAATYVAFIEGEKGVREGWSRLQRMCARRFQGSNNNKG